MGSGHLTIKTQLHNMNIPGRNTFLSNLSPVDRWYFIGVYNTFVNSTETIFTRIDKMINPDEFYYNIAYMHVLTIFDGDFQKHLHVNL